MNLRTHALCRVWVFFFKTTPECMGGAAYLVGCYGAFKAMIKRYLGISWDTTDLVQCKNACRMLIREGISYDEILALDFGALDIVSVWEEYWND